MDDNQQKIYLFYCSNGFKREDVLRCCKALDGVEVKAVALPCSGKVDVPYFMKAFETGADGAVLLGCEPSECQHLEGTIRGSKRAKAVDELLQEIGVGSGRMTFVGLNGDGVDGAVKKIEQFGTKIKQMGATV